MWWKKYLLFLLVLLGGALLIFMTVRLDHRSATDKEITAIETREARPDATKNVVILVADTLRADHLGCYGYRRRTSPRMNGLADVATRYPRAVSSSPWTLPSHASLFTGLYSFEHGAHTYLLEKEMADKETRPTKEGTQKWSSEEYKLDGRYLTLAEFLSNRGYATGAVVANAGYLSKRWKLHQGFRFYKVKPGTAKRVNQEVFAWLEKVKKGNFFLFVNYMDTHRIYNTIPRPGLLPGPVVRDKGQLLNKLIYRMMDPANAGKGIPADVAGKVIDQYDTAVSNVDEGIGDVVKYLRRQKLYDNTMLVVTSDHGEFFGEHRLVEHSKDVYQEVLHVPLLFKAIGQRRRKVSGAVVSTVDIPGMVVRGLGGGVAVRGKRAFKRIPGNHPVISENYFSRAKDVSHPLWGSRFLRIRAALFDYPYKYILSSDGNDEMYDIKRDKAEARDLKETDPERARRYRKQLWGFVDESWKKHRPPQRMSLSDDEKAQLKALGYLD